MGAPPPDAMDPQELLQDLCRRHGLDPGEHADLLPLTERAAEAPLDERQRLLGLVFEALRLRASRAGRAPELERAIEEGLLLAVARALHGWSPEQGPLDPGLASGGL